MQSKSGIFGEKFNEASRKKGFPFAKGIHRNKSNVGALVNGVPTLTQTDAELTALFDFVLNEATLSNAAVKTSTDAQGQFYYLGATATRPNQSSPNPIVIVLTQRGDELIFTSSGDGAGCVMECVPRFSCTSCEQTLVERCTSQRCSCTSGSGGCGTRIIFPE